MAKESLQAVSKLHIAPIACLIHNRVYFLSGVPYDIKK